MTEPVKTRRYDNSRRQAQVQATRAEVVAAARRLFVERGYPATTIEAVADAAATPIATVYRLFGSKRGILSAVLDVSYAGDDAPVAVGDRQVVADAMRAPDPAALLAAFAHLRSEILARAAPVEQVLSGAAEVDREAGELLARANRQRLAGQSRIARELARRGALADGVDENEAVDVIYALMSRELYRILTVEREWSAERYERWLAKALAALLLPPPGRSVSPRG
jgi:AcrR family transcriptional regulator